VGVGKENDNTTVNYKFLQMDVTSRQVAALQTYMESFKPRSIEEKRLPVQKPPSAGKPDHESQELS